MSYGTNGCSRFHMILGDDRKSWEVCIYTANTHSPQGRDWNSPQVCTLGMPCCERVMDVPERYEINLGKFADFPQTVTSFRHVSSQEKSFWFHSSYHCNEGDLAGIERYWGKMINNFADVISLSWSWGLTGRSRLEVSHHFGDHKWNKMCLVYTWHKLV